MSNKAQKPFDIREAIENARLRLEISDPIDLIRGCKTSLTIGELIDTILFAADAHNVARNAIEEVSGNTSKEARKKRRFWLAALRQQIDIASSINGKSRKGEAPLTIGELIDCLAVEIDVQNVAGNAMAVLDGDTSITARNKRRYWLNVQNDANAVAAFVRRRERKL
jgi:hypothetical protein